MAAKFNLLIAAKTSGSAAIKRMGNSMQGLQGKLKNVGLSLRGVNKGFAALGLALGGGAFVGMVKNAVDLGDSFGKLSTQTGIASNTLMAYVNAGKLAGVQQETIDKGLRRLAQSMREADQGVATYKDAFDALGLSVRNTAGTLKSSEQVLAEISDEFKGMENGATKAALAMELLGRSGASLIPFLNMGAEGIKQFNFELSEDFARNAEDFNDTMTRIKFSFQGAYLQLVDKLLPTLNDLAISIEKFLNNKSNLESLFDSINTGLTGMIEAITILNNVLKSKELQGFMDFIMFGFDGNPNKNSKLMKELADIRNKRLGVTTLTDKDQQDINKEDQLIKLLDTLKKGNGDVNTLTGSVKKLNNQWKQGAKDGLTKYREGMKDIATRVSDMVVNSFKKMEDALVNFVMTGQLNFRNLANSIIKDMARIAIQQTITAPFSNWFSGLFKKNANGNVYGQNGIVPFANGGIVTKPTVFPFKNGIGLMGEAGAEAILPLTRRNGVLGVEGGGTTNVVVNVDAKGQSQVQGDQGQAAALGRAISAAVTQELVRQKRPGGLLSPA